MARRKGKRGSLYGKVNTENISVLRLYVDDHGSLGTWRQILKAAGLLTSFTSNNVVHLNTIAADQTEVTPDSNVFSDSSIARVTVNTTVNAIKKCQVRMIGVGFCSPGPSTAVGGCSFEWANDSTTYNVPNQVTKGIRLRVPQKDFVDSQWLKTNGGSQIESSAQITGGSTTARQSAYHEYYNLTLLQTAADNKSSGTAPAFENALGGMDFDTALYSCDGYVQYVDIAIRY